MTHPHYIDQKAVALLPCPFCGSVGETHQLPHDGHAAGCSNDDCIAHQVAFDFVSAETAIAAWNRRPAPMEAVAWREALSRQCDNMAFLLNHAPIVQRWYDKFTAELAEDRQALAVIPTPEDGRTG